MDYNADILFDQVRQYVVAAIATYILIPDSLGAHIPVINRIRWIDIPVIFELFPIEEVKHSTFILAPGVYDVFLGLRFVALGVDIVGGCARAVESFVHFNSF